MENPWLAVPLTDYEGHMKSAAVRQMDALSDLFAEALTRCRPASVAVIGIAGGNGLERIDASVTRRIVGFDINPEYLEVVRRRYPAVREMSLVCADLSRVAAAHEPVQLVHAAVVLEHAGAGLCLDNALRLVADGGFLSVVLQLPSDREAGVSPSEFVSMRALSPGFALIDPAWFTETMAARGFRKIHEIRRPLESGKAFWMGIFARENVAE